MSSDFIEIKDGITINTDMIEAIVDVQDTTRPTILSKVFTANNSYLSTLPRKAILQLININESTEDETNIAEKAFNILEQQSNFAG